VCSFQDDSVVEVKRYLNQLPSVIQAAEEYILREYSVAISSNAKITPVDYSLAEYFVAETVDKFNLHTGNELVDIETFDTLLNLLLSRVCTDDDRN
jgi:hypothetical protein